MPIPDPVPFLLVLARIAGLILAAPVFGHTLVPARVRVALAAVLALALAPALPAPAAAPATLWGLAGALAVESAVGVLLGFTAQLVFAGVALGGQLAGMQMGFGVASLFDPTEQTQVTVVAQWQQLLVLVVFLVLDVHHLLLRALIQSFRLVPVGTAALGAPTAGGVVTVAGDVFGIAVRLAAPVLVVLLLTNATLGVLARVIPQLNVFVLGFPVNVGAGLVALGAALPFTVRFLAGRFGALGPVLDQLVRGLGHG
ncbi:MAG TPA: flagellar biosynthetic protein FliR [Candidatus Binatia bacterium]|nr:flagellar biosynthetic protein FliR [Candidatus Binatia bacterium]